MSRRTNTVEIPCRIFSYTHIVAKSIAGNDMSGEYLKLE